MNKRKGHFFYTYTGRKFWPIDPRPEDVCLEDIAHALSLVCRWGGHCRTLYTVGEHSVLGSFHLRGEDALAFLLHDAPEAYLHDFMRPLKHAGLFGWLYRRIERRVDAAIREAFAVKHVNHGLIKHIDNRMLVTEARDLCAGFAAQFGEQGAEPFNYTLKPHTAEQVERAFINRFNALTTR